MICEAVIHLEIGELCPTQRGGSLGKFAVERSHAFVRVELQLINVDLGVVDEEMFFVVSDLYAVLVLAIVADETILLCIRTPRAKDFLQRCLITLSVATAVAVGFV